MIRTPDNLQDLMVIDDIWKMTTYVAMLDNGSVFILYLKRISKVVI